MDIKEYLSTYKVHPVIFVGTGLSLRYYEDSYTWEALLSKIVEESMGSREAFLDLKSQCMSNRDIDYPKLGTLVEKRFNEIAMRDRNGKFRDVNDEYYRYMEEGLNISRFKLYVAKLFSSLHLRTEKLGEIEKLKKARKNISSVITTNYDKLIENELGFSPLIGNNILLSNPYGSVYKIHGSVDAPADIVITKEDYETFDERYGYQEGP